jgi:hypothetical protein
MIRRRDCRVLLPEWERVDEKTVLTVVDRDLDVQLPVVALERDRRRANKAAGLLRGQRLWRTRQLPPFEPGAASRPSEIYVGDQTSLARPVEIWIPSGCRPSCLRETGTPGLGMQAKHLVRQWKRLDKPPELPKIRIVLPSDVPPDLAIEDMKNLCVSATFAHSVLPR